MGSDCLTFELTCQKDEFNLSEVNTCTVPASGSLHSISALLWRSCRLILVCFLGTALFPLETILILNPCPTNPKSCRCMVLVDSASSGTQSKIEWCISFIYQFQKDFIRSKDWILFFYHPSSYYICSYHVFKKSHLSTMYIHIYVPYISKSTTLI